MDEALFIVRIMFAFIGAVAILTLLIGHILQMRKGRKEKADSMDVEQLKEKIEKMNGDLVVCQQEVVKVVNALRPNLREMDFQRLMEIEQRLEALENENGWQYQGNGEYAERRPNGDLHSR